MPLVPMGDLLAWAQRDGYAVPAFDLVNLEWLQAFVEAAEDRRSPLILAIAQVHFPWVDMELISPAIHRIVAQANVPVAVHLDHGVDFNAVVRALRCGFTSIMFDGSDKPFEENVALVSKVVEMCHSAGITVEAELGHVGGEEGGMAGTAAEERFFTDPEEAREFVRRTGVDALAVSIGNVHGAYKGEPRLDFDRLRRLRDATGIPLVLHGGSGLSQEDYQRAISLGIHKINIYADLSNAGTRAVWELLKGAEGREKFTLVSQAAREGVYAEACRKIDIFGCADRCREPTPLCELCGGCDVGGRRAVTDTALVSKVTEAVLRALQDSRGGTGKH